MPWIKSDQAIERHPKTLDLMMIMGWDLDTTIGKLHRFWYWCVDYAEDGDLQKHNDARIGAAVGLNGEANKLFVDAMVTSRWVDREPYFRVHDWWDHNGAYLCVKYKNKPELWHAVRAAYQGKEKRKRKNPANNSCKGGTDITPTTDTKPNQTINKRAGAGPPEKKPPSGARELQEHYREQWRKKYGRGVPTSGPVAKLTGIKCAELLNSCGGCLEDAKAVIDRYLADEGIFYNGHSMAMLTSGSVLQRFLTDRKGNTNGTRKPAAQARGSVENLAL